MTNEAESFFLNIKAPAEKIKVVKVDEVELTRQHYKDLSEMTQQADYPRIFIGKRHVGNLADVMDSYDKQVLQETLEAEKIPHKDFKKEPTELDKENIIFQNEQVVNKY